MAKIKVLFLASDPFKTQALALDEEIRAITAQIRSAEYRDMLELVSAWAVRPDDLQQLLLQHRPHVVHFSGHGTTGTPIIGPPPTPLGSGRELVPTESGQDAQLVLMGERGEPQPVSQEALVELIDVLKGNIRVVVLNACHTKPQAEAIAQVIDCCIGMNAAIGDKAAIVLAAAFYRALGFGQDVQTAYKLGKHELKLKGIPQDQIPELHYRREEVDPAKVVLRVKAPNRARARQTAVAADPIRVRMIEKVRTSWITGFLEQSLFQQTRIILDLSKRTDIVTRPLDLLVKRPDQGERPLQPGTRVVDVYDKLDHALLILGAPGSGKTTLLLELARDLLIRAANDPTHPIPVVFPLSTWAETRKPLVEWLKDELNLRYDVSRKIAQQWVVSDQVLPMLDGLDEVKAVHRAACVEAVNAFRQSHGLLPLVVTSRTADYEALAEPLRLQGAILVQSLTREQVNAYLTELGPAGELVGTALHEDSSLWELMDSPLLLFIITVTYAGQTEGPPTMSGTVAERRDRLFGSYVNEVLDRGASKRSYTREQTAHGLSWLAYQMANHGQTVFYLERLQLDWLPQRQRQIVRVSNWLIGGLVGGLVIVLYVGLFLGLVVRSVVGLVAGLVVGSMIIGLVGLVGGLIVWLARLAFGLVPSSEETVCVETVRWSWSELRQSMSSILVVVLIAGLAGGLLFGLIVGLMYGQVELELGLSFGLFVWLFLGLILGLREGRSFSGIETRAVPNEGIRRSARNALISRLFSLVLVVFVFVLSFGLGSVLIDGLRGGFGWLRVALFVGLTLGLVVGLFVSLRAGGEACLKHVVLRLWLIRHGSTPWNYVRFLDYAAERILLRKVGGGYVFLHRMLLEYFAARYAEPGIETTATAK